MEFPAPPLITEPALPARSGDASSAGGAAWRDSAAHWPRGRKRVRRDRTRGRAAPSYIELHCHSAFSFLDGASTPLELAATAAELGYPALALTDHDGVWGSMEFVHACRGFGV